MAAPSVPVLEYRKVADDLAELEREMARVTAEARKRIGIVLSHIDRAGEAARRAYFSLPLADREQLDPPHYVNPFLNRTGDVLLAVASIYPDVPRSQPIAAAIAAREEAP